ncbi:MAG TPA: hypothetical protein VF817_00820 [Patescibacteria group bacterium]
MKSIWQHFKTYMTQPSATTFGSRRKMPLWRSVLADYVCIFSFGYYKP